MDRNKAHCWSEIGIRGNASCPELERHVHCRNCPVYSAAAVGLFDSSAPAGYLADWTNHFSGERELDAPDTVSILIFRIGFEWLALPAPIFMEVAELRAIHSVPHRRGSVVRGLVNVRGALLICVSLDTVLGLKEIPESKHEKHRTAQQRLLVVSHESKRMAFFASEVHGIHRFHEKELRDVPATVAKATATYTKALLPWQTKSVALLDDQLLFYTLNRSLG